MAILYLKNDKASYREQRFSKQVILAKLIVNVLVMCQIQTPPPHPTRLTTKSE